MKKWQNDNYVRRPINAFDPVHQMMVKSIKSWSISYRLISNDIELRMDAVHYLPEVIAAIDKLESSGMALKRLSEVADVFLPGPFVRTYGKDSSNGYRYINASTIEYETLHGEQAGPQKYLSKLSKTNVSKLILKKGWLVLSCSGTIGSVYYVSDRFNGCAASHDLIRIVPKDPRIAGYLYAYISSALAQVLINSHTFGSHIDHINEKQLGRLLVPLPTDEVMYEMHDRVASAFEGFERANDGLSKVLAELNTALRAPAL